MLDPRVCSMVYDDVVAALRSRDMPLPQVMELVTAMARTACTNMPVTWSVSSCIWTLVP